MAKRKRTKGPRMDVPTPWKPPSPEQQEREQASRLIAITAENHAKASGAVDQLVKTARKFVKKSRSAKAEA